MVWLRHTAVGPEVNAPGCPGWAFTVIASVRGLPGHEPLLAVTLNVPLVAEALKLMETLFVVPVMVAPVPE